MLGWLGVLLIIIALWYHYFYQQVLIRKRQNDENKDDGVAGSRIRSKNIDVGKQLSPDDVVKHFYQAEGKFPVNMCVPDVTEFWAGMFNDLSGSPNLGLRVGDVPPEIFY